MERAAPNAEPRPLRTLFVGDAEHVEFRAAVAFLQATTQLACVADLQGALAAVDELDPPDLIVVAQSWSGSVDEAALDRLRRRVPLARVIALLGQWCAGETRSGRPLAGAVRVAWHEFDSWWRAELARWDAGRCPAWGLPITATDDERLLFALDGPTELAGTIGIAAAYETAQCWSAMCRTMGLESVTISSQPAGSAERPAIDILLFDADGAGGQSRDVLIGFARRWRGTPLIAVLDFPRSDVREALAAAGVSVVLGRPLALSELRSQLNALLRRSPVAAE